MIKDQFRACMRRVCGAVTIVTTTSATGERRGVTATAVTSLTADPPAIIACINRETWVGQLAPVSGVFCVNILSADQQQVAETFAGRSHLVAEDRFTVGEWGSGLSGAPILHTASASIDCKLVQTVDFHTHVILIGEVVEARLGTGQTDPLLYFNGQFTTTALQAAIS